jgi:tetratricopeptide (TPR) repeat protein
MRADELKAKIGLSGPPLQAVHGGPPMVPDHELIRRIGQGSYGEVWLARNTVGTWRAVKAVYRDNFKDARPYEREFAGIQKYEPISRTNEGLVDVLQIGRNDEAGYFYYVMELADDGQAERSDGVVESWSGAPEKQRSKTPSLQHSASSYVPKTLAREIRARGRLSVEECITLGMTLNLALGHLHRHGLIHRDVKPSNIIFVSGVPKLADIGLVTELAEAQSFVGTEGFIPPEGPNSPQADLYALGKALYEAAMGKDRQEFPEPFTALGVDGESVALMELNEVLLRACAENPKQRYETAEEMNADLALLHSGESVQRKHALERRLKLMTRLGVGAATVVLLGVIPYVIAIREAALARAAANKEIAQRQRADQAAHGAETARKQAQADAQKAKTEAAKREQVAKFLEQMLEGVRPSVALGRDVTVLREIVNLAAEGVSKDLSGQPEVECELWETLAQIYDDLGLYQREEALARQSLEFGRTNFTGDHPALATAANRLGFALNRTGKAQQGEPFLREGLEMRLRLFGPEHAAVADSLRRLGRLTEALAIYQKLGKGHEREVAMVLGEVGNALSGEHKLAKAEVALRQALDLKRALFGNNHPDVAEGVNDLALTLKKEGKLSDAEVLVRESLAMTRQMWGPQHRSVSIVLYNLGGVLRAQKRLAEAEDACSEAVLVARRQQEMDWLLPMTLGELGITLMEEGKLIEAEQLFREAVETRARVDDESAVALEQINLADALNRHAKFAEAEATARNALATREKSAPEDWRTFYCRSLLGDSLAGQQKYADAEPLLISGYEGMQARVAGIRRESRIRVKEALERLAQFYTAAGRPEEASRWKEKLADFKP